MSRATGRRRLGVRRRRGGILRPNGGADSKGGAEIQQSIHPTGVSYRIQTPWPRPASGAWGCLAPAWPRATGGPGSTALHRLRLGVSPLPASPAPLAARSGPFGPRPGRSAPSSARLRPRPDACRARPAGSPLRPERPLAAFRAKPSKARPARSTAKGFPASRRAVCSQAPTALLGVPRASILRRTTPGMRRRRLRETGSAGGAPALPAPFCSRSTFLKKGVEALGCAGRAAPPGEGEQVPLPALGRLTRTPADARRRRSGTSVNSARCWRRR